MKIPLSRRQAYFWDSCFFRHGIAGNIPRHVKNFIILSNGVSSRYAGIMHYSSWLMTFNTVIVKFHP